MEKYNRGTKYLDKNRPEKAIPLLKAQLKQAEFKEVWLNLGNAYRLQNKDVLARDAYLKANDPAMPTCDGKFGTYDLALNNLGLLCFKHGETDNAIQFYRSCLEKNSNHFDAIWNYAIALLRKGCSGCEIDWNLAWKMYEYRFRKGNAVRVTSGVRPWDMISRVNKIVVLAEQGQGDKIMFGRYVNELRKFCNEVIVECPPGMEGLFNAVGVTGWSGRYEAGDAFGIPMCSLAARFGINNDEWLRGIFGKWSPSGVSDRPKIGIVWSGSKTHANNYNRSCNVGYFKRFETYGDLISLAPDAPVVPGVKVLGSGDWVSTAKAMLGLDLVISIDTSIVHLAGSLGIPCFMVQPIHETDFRWGDGVSISPWYKSVRIFQNKGWDRAFAEIETAVKDYFSHEKKFARWAMNNDSLKLIGDIDAKNS